MAEGGLDPIGGTLRLTGKIGVVCYPTHGSSAEELVSRAETTLRQAQQHPLDAILVFNPELREQDTQTHYLLQRLHAAIDERRLVLHFQPVLELAGNTVRHYEALVRIQNADGTLMPPGEFIPAAEKSGLITRIDYRVLELAISHLTGLEAAGRDITLAVNISGEHLGDDALFRWLARIFEEGGVTPGRLLFEITETTAVRNLLRAKAFMEPLKALGCRFALDDFGVGFTTFAHLRNLPVDMIKIDGSFVRDLPTNPENHALVKAMTQAAHSLGKQVTAEYTESAMVLAVLRDLGVDYAQGYYIGRPGPELAEVNVPGVLRRQDKIA
jgi:EAL domain-containing protein (putative c-di-GMP-specific phosphodiesterase class I)